MKLNVGCGDMILPGYINVDLYNPKADVKCDTMTLPYEDKTIEEVFSCHVLEHFDYYESTKVLTEWRRVLITGGRLVIETPDMLALSRELVKKVDNNEYYAHLFPGFFGYPWFSGHVHKFVHTPQHLTSVLKQVGMTNVRLEPTQHYLEYASVCMRVVSERKD